MLVIVTGGSGSGKSAYAENYIDMAAGNVQKYYIATMQVSGEEGRRKVERHQRMRADRGFLTIEQPVSVEIALQKMKTGKAFALLECMSNLAANEMFGGDCIKPGKEVFQKIINGIEMLQQELTCLVIVTNNVFEDGITYDETTMEYMRVLGAVNRRLADMADEVTEVVAGIPLTIKAGGVR